MLKIPQSLHPKFACRRTGSGKAASCLRNPAVVEDFIQRNRFSRFRLAQRLSGHGIKGPRFHSGFAAFQAFRLPSQRIHLVTP